MKKLIIALIFLGILTIAPPIVLAETKLQVNWPSTPMGTPLTDQSNLTNLIAYLYEWLIALGGLAAFIALVMAGFQYLTSAGNPGKMQDAMSRLKSALLGLGLLFGSWLVLNTINPQLTTLRMPFFSDSENKLKIEIKPVEDYYQDCIKVEVVGQIKAGEVKPGTGCVSGTSIDAITIYGSCRVEFFSQAGCKNNDLVHIESFFAPKDDPNTAEDESRSGLIRLTDRIKYEGGVEGVGVRAIKVYYLQLK